MDIAMECTAARDGWLVLVQGEDGRLAICAMPDLIAAVVLLLCCGSRPGSRSAAVLHIRPVKGVSNGWLRRYTWHEQLAGRKVRAPQGKVPGNAWGAQAYGKCHRKYTASCSFKPRGKGEMVR